MDDRPGFTVFLESKHYVLCAHLFNKHSMIYVLRIEGRVGEGVRGETGRGRLGWVGELRPLLKVI